MTNQEIKNKINQLADKYPDLDRVEIDYSGAGDSFDSMYSNTAGVEPEDYEDIVWELIERVGSDFNNDGGHGNVIIDLINKSVTIDDYYYETTSNLNDSVTID